MSEYVTPGPTRTTMERLKLGIWDIHEGVAGGAAPQPPAQRQAEPEQDNIMKGTLPKFKYVANLGQRYLLQRGFEAHLDQHRISNRKLASVVTDDQFHAPKAAADLRFFGVDPERVEPVASTVAMLNFFAEVAAANPADLLAIHYVIEGSNNGARYIARAVRSAYGLQTIDGTWHLDPYGEGLRARWKAVGDAINALEFSEEDIARMVLLGRRTFHFMNAIAAESYALPEPALR